MNFTKSCNAFEKIIVEPSIFKKIEGFVDFTQEKTILSDFSQWINCMKISTNPTTRNDLFLHFKQWQFSISFPILHRRSHGNGSIE
jgi:hypothetical protein